ncbi:MAG: RnfABCDGE type electron transport complex subunit D [Ruminococcaceae bacterium]|nr:RnfABCDGE type electron transport complex subunit D [Oscillospiraceae bacterium]
MSQKTVLSVSPHIHSGRSTAGIMRDVLIALLPTTVAGAIIFGARALLVVALSVACAVGFEALFNVLMKKEQTVGDCSAAVTGLLLALNLPANIPLWQIVAGDFFAIVVVKCLFGGLGYNLVNPAIAARVLMLVSFDAMISPCMPTIVDTVATATPLAEGAHIVPLYRLFLGIYGGTIGETCTLAILLGFAYLLFRRVITWHIPVSFIACALVLCFLLEGFDAYEAMGQVMSGSLLLGAVFMATDYVTSPVTPVGRVIFGVGAGLITVLIRYFGAYPEGVSFAILFMNILTPYIDRLTRRHVFGKGGKTV